MLADPMNRYTYSVKKIQYFSNMYLITGCIKFTGPIINSSYTRSGLPLSSLSYVNSSFLPLPSVRLHLSSVLFMSVNFSFLPLPSVSLMYAKYASFFNSLSNAFEASLSHPLLVQVTFIQSKMFISVRCRILDGMQNI